MILGIGDKYSERIVVNSSVMPYTFNATTTGNEQIITARFLYEDSKATQASGNYLSMALIWKSKQPNFLKINP